MSSSGKRGTTTTKTLAIAIGVTAAALMFVVAVALGLYLATSDDEPEMPTPAPAPTETSGTSVTSERPESSTSSSTSTSSRSSTSSTSTSSSESRTSSTTSSTSSSPTSEPQPDLGTGRSDVDERGWIGTRARCHTGDEAFAVLATADGTHATACRTPGGSKYYRGDAGEKGSLEAPIIVDEGDRIVARNGGWKYQMSPDGLLITENDKVRQNQGATTWGQAS
ncbi:hypothetical protein QP932_10605 [Corynebacterium freneyi]|uniref:hypothetical protein n=1 Tax=Corynebacterium freneyi TaxID=134034 RepID=UPI00254E81E2|nr:hypothetical protein [Corynebacterium freneyi]MDK8768941.1 hypothetical protein [Corynebacterium freneyi]